MQTFAERFRLLASAIRFISSLARGLFLGRRYNTAPAAASSSSSSQLALI